MRLHSPDPNAPQKEEPGGTWGPTIVALVLMALCFVRALSWQLIGHSSPDLRLTPRGEQWQAVLAMAMPLFPAGALIVSAVLRRLKTRVTVVLALLAVLGAVGGMFARSAWVPMFAGHYQRSLPSPDGTREAHLWVDGMLGCRATIYVAERGELWGVQAASRSVDCDTMGVRWLDGGVEVTGEEPRPLNLF